MPKDYAAKKSRRSKATRFNDVDVDNGSFKTVLYSMVFGVVLALVAVYFYQNSTPVEPQVDKKEPPKSKPSAKTRYKAVPAEDVDTNEFKYHEELKKKTIEVETPDLPQPSVKGERRYIMQCGSFRLKTQAETLRAEIGMNGFEARINSTSEQSGIWYRVQIGPYTSKRQAERDRHQLERNNVNQCVIW